MTTIRIPPLVMDGSATGSADCIASIRLVDALGHPMIGLRTTDDRPVTATATRTIPAGGPAWEVDLTPQSQIARADGRPSYYSVSLRLPQRTELWRIQVPESPDVLELADLVAGAAVSPGDIIAGRLMPPPGDLPDGRTLTSQGGLWVPSQPVVWQRPWRHVMVTQDYTLEPWDWVWVRAPGLTLTLPSDPAVGDYVRIANPWDSPPVADFPATLTVDPGPQGWRIESSMLSSEAQPPYVPAQLELVVEIDYQPREIGGVWVWVWYAHPLGGWVEQWA